VFIQNVFRPGKGLFRNPYVCWITLSSNWKKACLKEASRISLQVSMLSDELVPNIMYSKLYLLISCIVNSMAKVVLMLLYMFSKSAVTMTIENRGSF
jgi:hypothetical protein